MKQIMTNAFRYALILSLSVHVILVLVLTRLYLNDSSSIDEITYFEITEVQPRRATRSISTLKDERFIPPKFDPTKHQQVTVTVDPPVIALPALQPIKHQNPILHVSGIKLPNPKITGIGGPRISSSTPVGNHGIGNRPGIGELDASNLFPKTKRESHKVPIDTTLPYVSDLPMPSVILARIGQHIVSNRGADKVDVVFIIDGSGSMKDNINAVRSHLNRMTALFNDADLDFTLGVVIFRDKLLGLDFEVFPQTRSIAKIKRRLSQVKCRGGEQALDALIRAADEVAYRRDADVHFILITDEYVSGNYSAKDVLRKMLHARIKVDVVGRDEPFQKFITNRTGGLWLPISSLGTQ